MKKNSFFLTTTIFIFLASQAALAQKTNAKKIETNFGKEDVRAGFADVVKDLLPVAVMISTDQEDENSQVSTIDQILSEKKRGNESSIASGLLISKDGMIVTNHHVIENAERITVKLDDGSKRIASVVGVDRKTDLALIRIETDKELPFAKFGDSQKARVGDWVIVVGNPYGLGKSVSVGIVSAKSRNIVGGQIEEFIQTDAAINNGNSGGPMFNSRGEVIGINTAIFSPAGGNIGIGFAIPAATVLSVTKQLRERGEVERGSLGISVQEINDDIAESMKIDKNKGVFVVDVVEGEAAAKAGIMPTDIILKFNEQEVFDVITLPQLVANYPVGKTAKLTILRAGKLKTVNAVIAKLKDDNQPKKSLVLKPGNENKVVPKQSMQLLGIGLTDLNDRLRKSQNIALNVNGLLVTNVIPRSEAAEKNIVAGDVIISVNQSSTASVASFKNAVDEARKSGSKIFLMLRRGDSNYSAVLNSNR